jgi:acylaminoacyl-peptidase
VPDIPDFGDSLAGKKAPSIFLVDVTNPSDPNISLVAESESDGSVAYGQPIFAGDMIIAVGYVALRDRRRVGIIYCQNRLAQLFMFGVNLRHPKLTRGAPFTDIQRSCRFPRSDGKHLVYLSNKIGGAHGSCNQLHMHDLPDGKERLVKEVGTPATIEDFPGLFIDQLAPHPFLSGASGSYIAVTSTWRSRKVPLLISLADCSVRCLAQLPKPGPCESEDLMSYKVLAAKDSQVLMSRSLLNVPEEVVLLDVKHNALAMSTLWAPRISSSLQDLLKTASVAIIPISGAGPTEIIFSTCSKAAFEALKTLAQAGNAFVNPCKIQSGPSAFLPSLITNPHGGPHMGHSTEWNPSSLGEWVCPPPTRCQLTAWHRVLAGYSLALVNFVGSTGFGQDNIEKLLGHVGVVDVASIVAAEDFAIGSGLAIAGKQFVEGLSHGGYMTCVCLRSSTSELKQFAEHT